MVVSLYAGTVVVWNHETQMIVKTFELCDLPVRVAKFVARKHWIITGADDMQIRVFNYNTLERVYMFEAHSDYIRCIAVHPSQPFILTSSDDMLIKLWDWDRKWICNQVFEGHSHYVMQIVINPKDNNQFASASLDRTIKVWQLGSKMPNFTLEGHEKGVNCVDYYCGGDKPYLISGADDHLVKIWDYQNKTCVQTLEGHAQNVTCVSFHPELPIILTGSEDGTVRVWHSNTYRLENTLNYGMERAWCIGGRPGSNSVALGYDEGSILIQLGREEPAMSMDSTGKVMWARHSEVQQANLKVLGETEIQDGERLPLGVKDMGSCEIYPQSIQHSPNGRFVVVCGDGEYIIYTAMALRNKSFGSAQEFVWAHDSSQYAIREGNSAVNIFKNFKQKKTFKPDYGADGIFGGFLLGVRSNSGLAFYDWENTDLIRRIEIQPKHIFWSDSGELVCIATDESFFVLRYLPERILAAQGSKEEKLEDGLEDAFEVLGEVQEVAKTGVWVGDCFIYTTAVNRLNYYVGGEIITIAHMDRTMYLLGYIPKDDRLYLGDKELNIISYSLLLSVLEYQTAVMRKDFSTADRVLPIIPKEQRTRVALFLEKQGFRQQALAVSTDPEHKFELALQLGELSTAYQLALEAESEQKWKQLAEVATTKCQFSLAQECLCQAKDYGGLLLLATASGNVEMVGKLAEGAESDGKTNVAFLTYFLQGRLDECLDLLIKTNRLPEAAFLARTYLPSQVSRVVTLWKTSLSQVNQKAAEALADPCQYSNLFPDLQQALLAEQYLQQTHVRVRPAAEYPLVMPNEDRHILEESAGFMPKAEITEPEEVEGLSESVSEPAVTETVHSGEAAVEEPESLHQEPEDPPPPLAATTEHAALSQAPYASCEAGATEDIAALTSAEDYALQEPSPEVLAKETETVESSSVEDVSVQETAAGAEVQPSACIAETETIVTAEDAPREGLAAEDVLVSVDEMTNTDIASVSAASVEISNYDEVQTASEVPPATDTEVEETSVESSSTLETARSQGPVEELDAIKAPDSPVSEDAPLPVQASPDLTSYLPQGSTGDAETLLEPDSAQEPEPEEQATAPSVEVEDKLEPQPEEQATVPSVEVEDKLEPQPEEQATVPSVEVEEKLEPQPEEQATTLSVEVEDKLESQPEEQATAPSVEVEDKLESQPEEQATVPSVEVEDKLEPDVSASEGTSAQSKVPEEEEEEEGGSGASEEPAIDLEAEIDDEDLDDLDLDNFDLDDVDATDFNLEDDLLGE
ncbi:coatomer subunit beta'-like [Cololabis saira]|uniref:coatomer subunit beta'-like n=1 Tax=Cololabis saira TaxID=129043 RepID=UPI002AD2FDAC|nr:coatomer subunit beta'-like [Cololabis saira]